MRFLIAIFTLAVMMTTAQAQTGPAGNQLNNASRLGSNAEHSQQQNADKEKEQKAKADDKAYHSVLRNLPDKKYDPWGGIR
jgi:hypothetical protein